MNMKKLLYIFSLLALATSCELFELDNYDGPDAAISGNIIDAKTGENLAVECKFGNMFGGAYTGAPTEGYFSVYQKGWDYEAAQYWHLKNNGTYRNALVFSGTYRIEATANNFYPVTKDDVVINPGENVLDWEVTPYVRIIDPDVQLTADDKFVATFKCEFGDPSQANRIVNAVLCCYPDTFVGMYCNYCDTDPGASSTAIVADGKTVFSGKCYSIGFGNGKYSGSGMRQVPLAVPDDGYLDFLIVPKLPLAVLVKEVRRFFTGTMDRCPYTITGRCKCLQVVPLGMNSTDIVELDGEIIGRLPMSLEVTGEKIEVIRGPEL